MKRFVPLAIASVAVVGAVAVLVTAVDDSGRARLLFGLWRTRHVALAGALLVLASVGFAAARSRRALFGLLFSWLLVGLAIGLLEVVGLAGLVSYSDLMRNRPSVPTNDVASKRMRNADIEGLTYQDIFHSWGVEHEPIPFRYRTDDHGFRNALGGRAPEIVLLGDSIVVGALVDERETVSGVLAEATGQAVMNVALIGLAVQEEQALFRETVGSAEGLTILQFVFEGNDLLDSRANLGPDSEGRAGERAWSSLFERSFVGNVVLFLQRLSEPDVRPGERLLCSVRGEDYAIGWDGRSFAGVEGEIPKVLGSIEAFASSVREEGGRLGVVFVPTKLRVLGPFCEGELAGDAARALHLGPLQEAITVWGREAGIPVIDLTSSLVEATRRGEVPWFQGDTHWNAIGHRVAAESIRDAPFLEPESHR